MVADQNSDPIGLLLFHKPCNAIGLKAAPPSSRNDCCEQIHISGARAVEQSIKMTNGSFCLVAQDANRKIFYRKIPL
jgi:hypothetical protein